MRGGMEVFPKSPSEMVGGLRYFGRMLDKIRLRARGDLHSDYHANLGHRKAADGAMCNFLRIDYEQLRHRVLEGGSDEEILEWCYEKGRRLNEGDLVVWSQFMKKFGWKLSQLISRKLVTFASRLTPPTLNTM